MGSPERSIYGSPIPLSDIEEVLEWVDTFKLSRPTKKINRDFADAVLLAEMLAVAYPKLVEMHNYPPRNSQAQKLNNWMTLNRKVLKKLKLNLCIKTMEQLSNSIPGAIERVLIMVREKVKKDEEAIKSNEDAEGQEISSGGSYYEACSEEDNVLVVPVKLKNGSTVETVQKKVVSHEVYTSVREQLRDAKEANDTLKQKVDHFENMMKMKEERIEELQRQLARKATRRKENEELKNSLSVPISLSEPPSPKIDPKYNVERKPSETINDSIKEDSIIEDSIIKEYSFKEDIKKDNAIEPVITDINVIVKEEIVDSVKTETNVEIVTPNNALDDKKINDSIDDTHLNITKEKRTDSKESIKSRIPIADKLETKTSSKVNFHIAKESIDNLFRSEINIVEFSEEKES